jgi:transcriptional regulator with XRE-family HTH domain
MNALQHIVAEGASLFCNDLALLPDDAVRHYGAMDETDSNGGPNHLRAWREYRGLSQTELAELAGTTHQVIGYLERGRTQLSAKWLRKLAPVLDTTPGMLLDHAPEELSADIIDIWTASSLNERQQIVDLAKVVKRKTGTDD